MVNDEISDIANRIALGENKFEESQKLNEGIKAGMAVIKNATGISKHNFDDEIFGIMKEHEEFDLDTEITAAKYGDVVTEGYVPVFVEAPGAIKYAGSFLYKGSQGSIAFTEMGSPLAILEREVAATDTVAIVKLVK